MLTKDMTRAPGQTESFLLSWTCSYQNPFRLCLPSCVSAPLSQTRLLGPKAPLIPTGVGACTYYIKSNQRLFARPTRNLVNRLPNRRSIRDERLN